LWITIDDNECHYLKVLCDEIFGRQNFVANVVWQNRYSRSNDASLSLSHNHILVYAYNPESWKKIRNRLPRTEEQSNQYKNPDNDPNGDWRAIPWDAPNLRPNLSYPISTPSGRVRYPPEGRCWSRTEDQWLALVEAGLAYFGKNGDGAPAFKQYLKDAAPIVPNTWWGHDETGHTDEAKKEIHNLFGKNNAFDTPKPERLLQRIIHIATNPNDLVLDSFAGSGTTGAVAHKMGRRWIMVELGNHCHTHIIPRLQKVINGTDQGGISKAVNWQGGGGFRYYKLAPSLLQHDRWGNLTINPTYNAAMLAEALCKLNGYTYAPSDTIFWQHGYATERSFLYATTQTLTFDQLQALADEVGDDRALLIIAAAWRGITGEEASTRWRNLTLKKIPNSILDLCEWGKDDYSLNVANLPMAKPKPTQSTPTPTPKKPKAPLGQGSLFAEDEG
jgi:adenine-specific DNA-methyltransferase